MAAAGLSVADEHEAVGDYSIQSGRRCCRRIFQSDRPPTALFCSNDEMAFGAIGELRDMGLRVPEDVSVVGFDDIVTSDSFSPPLTTVSQPSASIGRTAMTMLLDILAGRLQEPGIKQIPTELIIRGSTGQSPR